MFPYGHKQLSRGFVELAIVRLKSEIPSHDLFCKFFIITRSGKKIKSHSADRCFTAEGDMSLTIRYTSNAKLQEMSSIFVPEGTLTVICVVRIKKIDGDDKFSQTESTTSFSSEYVSVTFNLIHFSSHLGKHISYNQKYKCNIQVNKKYIYK